ncbi:hypothetical protein DL98DRAFT_541246 [Cadophora sp. DSE1049]|nr:hypothetical protein DL98DRAFT_541246 [Cadophora sp. DSE1049]
MADACPLIGQTTIALCISIASLVQLSLNKTQPTFKREQGFITMVSELTTFHPFPRLPDELRLLIWNLASAHPRTVTIHAHPRQTQIAEYLISPSPIPAPLHTCRESRTEAFTTYTKAFHCPNNPRYTFVNFHVDTIRLVDFDLKKISAEDAGLTRWMTVEVRDSELFCYYYMFDLSATRRLEELRILSFVEPSDLWTWVQAVEEAYLAWFGEEAGWTCPKIVLLDGESGAEVQPSEHFPYPSGVPISGREGFVNHASAFNLRSSTHSTRLGELPLNFVADWKKNAEGLRFCGEGEVVILASHRSHVQVIYLAQGEIFGRCVPTLPNSQHTPPPLRSAPTELST